MIAFLEDIGILKKQRCVQLINNYEMKRIIRDKIFMPFGFKLNLLQNKIQDAWNCEKRKNRIQKKKIGNVFKIQNESFSKFHHEYLWLIIYDWKKYFFMELIVVEELQTIANCRFNCLLFRNGSFFMQFLYFEIETLP